MPSQTSEAEPPKFKTVGNYDWPAVPAEETLRKLRNQFFGWFSREDEDPFISDDVLRWAPRGKLDELASPPACGPVLRELAATFADWRDNPSPSHWLQLAVLPPCDKNDIVRSWAVLEGHSIVEPPERSEIINGKFVEGSIETEGLIVIPRLERWFMRHRNGLNHVRSLVDQLTGLKRHCVVGCNSWAWAYLSKAIGVDLAFPPAVTFQAFDALRLHTWFEELAENADEKCFRYVADGKDVFAKSDSGTLTSDYFHRLAARSLGTPWAAWHLWRRSLRFGPDLGDRIQQKFPDEDTVWIAPLETFSLPDSRCEVALLIMHAILIHGSLTEEELCMVIPSVDTSNVLVSLMAANFIEREGDSYYCTAAAYPTLRTRLAAAGFPMDRL